MPNEIGSGPGVKSIGKATAQRGQGASNPNREAGSFGAAGAGVQNRGSVRGLPATPQGKPSQRRADSGAPSTGSGAAGTGPGDGGGVQNRGQSGAGRPPAGSPPASAVKLQPVGVSVTDQNSRTLTVREQQPSLGGKNQAEEANRRGMENKSPQPFGSP